jgi:hypothetical protein
MMDRDAVIAKYHDRLNMSKPISDSNLMVLIAGFIASIASNDPIKLFHAELVLLREGHSDQDIGNTLLPVYRDEIRKQTANRKLPKELAMELTKLMIDFESGLFHRLAAGTGKREPKLLERDILELRQSIAEAYQAYWENSDLTVYTGDLKNVTRHKIISAIDAMMKWNNNPYNKKYEIGVQTIRKITGCKDQYIREVFVRYQSTIKAHNTLYNTQKRGRYNNDEAIKYCIDRLESIHGIPLKQADRSDEEED